MKIINLILIAFAALGVNGCTLLNKDSMYTIVDVFPAQGISSNDNTEMNIKEIFPKLSKTGIPVEGVNGFMSSLAVDGSLRPHLLVSEHPNFQVLYMSDNNNWRGDVYSSYDIWNSSQMGLPHIEVDIEKDILWGSGYGWHPSFDQQTFIIPDCSEKNIIADFKKFKIHNFSDGNGSLDQSTHMWIAASHNFQCIEAWAKNGKITEGGRVGYSIPSGGEKEGSWVSKAAPVKHGDGKSYCIRNYATEVWYQNSLRATNGRKPVEWASVTKYASMVDDMCYPKMITDNVSPGTAYFTSYYWHSPDYDKYGESNYGIFLNIWITDNIETGDGHFEFPSNDMLLIDQYGTSPKRYPPQLSPAKFGGVFVAYNRRGSVIIKYVPENAKDNLEDIREYDMGHGSICAISTDVDGNLHVVYRTNKMFYRKIQFYDESSNWSFGGNLLDNIRNELTIPKIDLPSI